MKKLAFILSASMALVSTAYAQTAVDVEATDDLNRSAEIKIVEREVVATEVAEDLVRVDETVTVTEITPNQVAGAEEVVEPLVGGIEGRWIGTVPCASCPGIDVDLTLNSDGTFTVIEQYQENVEANFNSTGVATYVADTGILTLKMTDGESRIMHLQEDQLLYIDADGNALPDYMLKRAQ
ncbi:MAG: copper resistance protein NlpE [Alcaligenaceae bacterium]|nr:copper resistance protein NlpE [Alcaligenaceae bacterium]